MKDVASQMQALDDFVTRARSQNERHHESHVASLQGMAATVRQSYTSIGEHFVSTYDRVRDLGSDMTERNSAIQASIPPLSSNIRQPLSELRASIANAPLREYIPTGDTPQKTTYQYPTTLPQTAPHEKLLARLNRPTPALSETTANLPSPSKAMIYTDMALPEDEVALLYPQSSGDSEPKPTSAGLREINVNVNAALPALRAADGAAPLSIENVMAPPLKRHATMESKLPTKLGLGKNGVVRLEGRENSLPVGQVNGPVRRLRSSPTT